MIEMYEIYERLLTGEMKLQKLKVVKETPKQFQIKGHSKYRHRINKSEMIEGKFYLETVYSDCKSITFIGMENFEEACKMLKLKAMDRIEDARRREQIELKYYNSVCELERMIGHGKKEHN